MLRVVLPWSQAYVPGINAEVLVGETFATDPIVTVAPSAAVEVQVIFAAFCALHPTGGQAGLCVAPTAVRQARDRTRCQPLIPT